MKAKAVLKRGFHENEHGGSRFQGRVEILDQTGLYQFRRTGRADRRHAPGGGGSAALNRREPISSGAQLLHASSRPRGATVGNVYLWWVEPVDELVFFPFRGKFRILRQPIQPTTRISAGVCTAPWAVSRPDRFFRIPIHYMAPMGAVAGVAYRLAL